MKNRLADFINDLLPVLVLYNCPLSQSATWCSASAEFNRIGLMPDWMIYDNSPEVQSLPDGPVKIYYRHNQTNPGVSKAYNEGFQVAIDLKKKWLLLLDQDSTFPPGWIESYYAAITKSEKQLVVPMMLSGTKIVSPFRYWLSIGRSPRSITVGDKSLNDFYAINSGVLVSTVLFEQAGGYDERIPLDFSDFAFMFKLKKLTAQLALVNVMVSHQFAANQKVKVKDAVTRFQLYCKGNRQFALYTHRLSTHYAIGLCRALKLSLRYGTFAFVNIFLRSLSGKL